MNGERNMEPYVLPDVKYRQSMGICYDSGNSDRGSVTT